MRAGEQRREPRARRVRRRLQRELRSPRSPWAGRVPAVRARPRAAGRSVLLSTMLASMPADSAAISARTSCDSLNTGSTANQQQQPVQVGGERLGLPLVLPEQQVAPRLDVLDHALVAARWPASARGRPRRPRSSCRAGGRSGAGLRAFRRCSGVHGPATTRPRSSSDLRRSSRPSVSGSSASILAAQMKSFIDSAAHCMRVETHRAAAMAHAPGPDGGPRDAPTHASAFTNAIVSWKFTKL